MPRAYRHNVAMSRFAEGGLTLAFTHMQALGKWTV